MAYQALYRKFRPETFEDVKGQDAIVTTLKNQIRSGRVGHAYLFTGTRGTGKTTVAKIFARAVNCQSPLEDGSPCGQCDICKGIADGTLMNVIEIDAATNNGVESIRTIINEVSYSPTKGKYKIYIIDEAHMLSTGAGGAFNALLKTLEEPPEYVIFILATTEAAKIPVTIISRCQRYDFHRMSIDTMVKRMGSLMEKEEARVEDRALRFIARMADGSMRDALSLLDQCLAFNYGQELTYDKALDVLGAMDASVCVDFMDKVIKQDLSGTLKILDDNIMRGREIGVFVNDIVWHMRNMLLVGTSDDSGADIADTLGVSTDTLEQIRLSAKKTDPATLMRFIRIFSELSGQIRFSAQKRVLTEIAIVKLMHPEMEDDVGSFKQRLAQVEKKIEKIEVEGVKTSKSSQKKERPSAPVPEALPEDVNLAAANWSKIVKNADPSIRMILGLSKPSTDGKRLIIKCMDEIQEGNLKLPENTALIDEVLERELKKRVAFEIYGVKKGEGENEVYPDISSCIDFPVETLEDEEEN